jgi:hypothetical protein
MPCLVANLRVNLHTAEVHLSGLIGKTSHSKMQNFRKIGSFFENRQNWQFGVGKKNTNCCFRLHIYPRTNNTVIHMYFLICIWKLGEILNPNGMSYTYSKKMFTRRAEPIRASGDPDNQRPDKWSSTVFTAYCHWTLSWVKLLRSICVQTLQYAF